MSQFIGFIDNDLKDFFIKEPEELCYFWSDGDKNAEREVIVTGELDLTALFEVSYFNVVFKIGDEVVSTLSVAYGDAIDCPEGPEKEGYTFVGWGDVPSEMPAEDLEFEGVYEVNHYTVTFKIGDEVVSTLSVAYGDAVDCPEGPEKEGYTFVGWGDVPSEMPAEDLVFEGIYTVNKYRLLVYLNDQTYLDTELEYGVKIDIPDLEVDEDYEFKGWQEEIPETMPSHDVTIHGYIVSAGVDGVFLDEELVTVCNINGVVIYNNIQYTEVRSRLTPGLYIINGRKVIVR